MRRAAVTFTADSYAIQCKSLTTSCIIVFMSETTTSDDPVTGPIEPVPPPPPPPPAATAYAVEEVPRHEHPTSRLNKVLAWVGIVAGSLFIVAIIFGTGFRIGLAVGSHGGGMGHHRYHGNGQMEDRDRGGPPHFPGGGGSMWRPGGPGFMFPPPPGFFPGGPGFPGGRLPRLPRRSGWARRTGWSRRPKWPGRPGWARRPKRADVRPDPSRALTASLPFDSLPRGRVLSTRPFFARSRRAATAAGVWQS